MTKAMIAGGALAGLVLTGAMVGTVAAQSDGGIVGMDEDKAVEIALVEVPGTVQDVELDDEDGVPIYEVEILSTDGQEYEVEIAADTGAVVEVETEDEDDDDDHEDDDHDDDNEQDDDDA